jgi:NADPH-dependent 7-cyano-7-deazaguanine reductase QueF-like protein
MPAYLLCPFVLRLITMKKEGDTMVELDQFKLDLNSFAQPLVEVRDSL